MKNIISIILTVFLTVISLFLLYDIILALLNISITLPVWFLGILNFIATISIGLGILIVLFFLFKFLLASFEQLLTQISKFSTKLTSSFKKLSQKIEESNSEKILPIVLPAFLGALTLLLSNDYTSNNIKILLTILLSILVGLVLLTTSRPKGKRLVGLLGILIIIFLCGFLLVTKYKLYNLDSIGIFVSENWKSILSMPYTNLVSIGIISLSFLILIGVSIVYTIKK